MSGPARRSGGNGQQKGKGEQGDSLESEASQAREPVASPRNYLANERTRLSCLRTGVALIGLGFAVARFGLFSREPGLREGALEQEIIGEHWSTLIGTAIIGLSALISSSYVRYRDAARAMERGEGYHSWGLSMAAAFSVVLIVRVLAAYLLLTS
jgi:putative membrane protein